MATYLDLVKATRLMVGMQGTGPSSIATAQGIEEVLARFVADAYVDIQNMREEFNFLLLDGQVNIAASKDTYTFLDIFATATPAFKKYKLDSVRITDNSGHKKYLRYVSRDVLEARYLNDDNEKLPTQYTVEPNTNSLIFKPIPNGLYTVDFRYWRSPEILSVDLDVPSLPPEFHNLIAYVATEKMAIYLGSAETYARYSQEAARMKGQLMRLEIPKMRLRAGALV